MFPAWCKSQFFLKRILNPQVKFRLYLFFICVLLKIRKFPLYSKWEISILYNYWSQCIVLTRMHSSMICTVRSSSPLSGGICNSAWWDTTPLDQTPPWSRHPPVVSPQSRHPSEQAHPQRRHLPGPRTPLWTDTHLSKT